MAGFPPFVRLAMCERVPEAQGATRGATQGLLGAVDGRGRGKRPRAQRTLTGSGAGTRGTGGVAVEAPGGASVRAGLRVAAHVPASALRAYEAAARGVWRAGCSPGRRVRAAWAWSCGRAGRGTGAGPRRGPGLWALTPLGRGFKLGSSPCARARLPADATSEVVPVAGLASAARRTGGSGATPAAGPAIEGDGGVAQRLHHCHGRPH